MFPLHSEELIITCCITKSLTNLPNNQFDIKALVFYSCVMAAFTWFWWRNLKERDDLGDPSVDGRIILRWIFRKWDVECGLVGDGSG